MTVCAGFAIQTTALRNKRVRGGAGEYKMPSGQVDSHLASAADLKVEQQMPPCQDDRAQKMAEIEKVEELLREETARLQALKAALPPPCPTQQPLARSLFQVTEAAKAASASACQ